MVRTCPAYDPERDAAWDIARYFCGVCPALQVQSDFSRIARIVTAIEIRHAFRLQLDRHAAIVATDNSRAVGCVGAMKIGDAEQAAIVTVGRGRQRVTTGTEPAQHTG